MFFMSNDNYSLVYQKALKRILLSVEMHRIKYALVESRIKFKLYINELFG